MTRTWLAQSARPALFALGVGGFAAGFGIYASPGGGFLGSWIYWTSLVGLGMATSALVRPHLAHWRSLKPWMLWPLLTLVISIPMFGFVIVAQGLIGAPVPVSGYVDAGLKVILATAAITGIGILRSHRDPTPAKENQISEPAAASSLPHQTLHARLRVELKDAAIQALGAEDHYVRVITDAGEDMLLMRLADAIKEVDGVDGLQVHRSWWVARAAASTIHLNADGGQITLAGGRAIPVSRRRAKTLRASGWCS